MWKGRRVSLPAPKTKPENTARLRAGAKLGRGFRGGKPEENRAATKAVAMAPALGCFNPVIASLALPGLTARLDKLVYHHGGKSLPPDKPHAFVYFITIHNGSERTVTLLGRKWVVTHANGSQLVVEGDKIVGETPRLAAGEQFSYNSYHVTAESARSQGSFHGVDDLGRRVHVVLPAFELIVPDEDKRAGSGDS